MTCDNCRSIDISPILSKVFEHCLLRQLQSFVNSDDNQFVFNKGVGCSHAIYSVRNIVDSWVSQGLTVNLCATDLSIAFDKVNYYALFIKLIRRNIPVQILDITQKFFSGCCWGNMFIEHGQTLFLSSSQC